MTFDSPDRVFHSHWYSRLNLLQIYRVFLWNCCRRWVPLDDQFAAYVLDTDFVFDRSRCLVNRIVFFVFFNAIRAIWTIYVSTDNVYPVVDNYWLRVICLEFSMSVCVICTSEQSVHKRQKLTFHEMNTSFHAFFYFWPVFEVSIPWLPIFVMPSFICPCDTKVWNWR